MTRADQTPQVPAGGAGGGEGADIQDALRQAQEARLTQEAERTGAFTDLLYFHAARRDRTAIQTLQDRTAEADPATHFLCGLLLAPDEGPGTAAYGAAAQQTDDPWAAYTLVKHALKRGDSVGATLVATTLLRRGRPSVGPLNLVGKHLLRAGKWNLAKECFSRSLQAGPGQADVEAMLDAAAAERSLDIRLYLDVYPAAPAVSYYLPIYNVEQYIERCLDAVLGQSHPLAEVLLVDDGSPDHAIDLVRGRPVTIIVHDENRGLAAARNTAFNALTAPLIATVDTDAAPEPTYTKCILMEFENGAPELAGVCGRMVEYDTSAPPDKWRDEHLSQDTGTLRRHSPLGTASNETRRAPDVGGEQVREFYMPGCNTVFRREAVLAIGGYDETHRLCGEDGDLARRLLAAGHTLVGTPNALVYHFRRDTVQSVIRTSWNHAFWLCVEAEAYASPTRLVSLLEVRFSRMQDLMAMDAQDGTTGLIYIDFMGFFIDVMLDLRYAEQEKLITAGQRRQMQRRILAPLETLDQRFGGHLRGRAMEDLEGLVTAPGPEEPLSEAVQAQFAKTAGRLDSLLGSYTESMYAVLRA